MSTLMSIKQNTIGQFTCSMRGHHSISNEDEDKLYSSSNNILETHCDMCGIRIRVEIEPKHPNIYKISRLALS
jgi:transcription elongation factor Elf1